MNKDKPINRSYTDQTNKENEGELTRVIYKSRSLMDEGREKELLDTCHKNNPRLDVTGVLVSHSGWIMQVLEGPSSNINKLIHVIEADPRHTDFLVINTTPIEKRDFQDWSMASVTLNALRFNEIIDGCRRGNNEAIEKVRDFLFYGKWQ
jgi:hypothetical protein